MNEELKNRIDRIGLKINFLAGLVGKSPSYVSKLISGDIVNYDEMERLKKIIRKYEDELDKNGLLKNERLFENMPEIKYAIKKNGLQKNWICVQLGISLAYMSYILNGKYNLSQTKKEKLINILNVYDKVRQELKLSV